MICLHWLFVVIKEIRILRNVHRSLWLIYSIKYNCVKAGLKVLIFGSMIPSKNTKIQDKTVQSYLFASKKRWSTSQRIVTSFNNLPFVTICFTEKLGEAYSQLWQLLDIEFLFLPINVVIFTLFSLLFFREFEYCSKIIQRLCLYSQRVCAITFLCGRKHCIWF